MVGKDEEAAPKPDGLIQSNTTSILLDYAGRNTINAAQMAFDRPQWKAFVCGLPTLEPEHGS